MMKLFNLSNEEVDYFTPKKIYCLIIYDITSNKRRLKLSKLLDGYGFRVQKSCYEFKIDKSSYKNLLDQIDLFYEEEENDNIIIYTVDDSDILRFNQFKVAFESDLLFF